MDTETERCIGRVSLVIYSIQTAVVMGVFVAGWEGKRVDGQSIKFS